MSPLKTIGLTFIGVILIGSILLSLPIATVEGEYTNYLDALYTSTSAVCVIGLCVVPTYAYWSFFGKAVILVLIQIGGLGLMTFLTMLNVMAKKKITLTQRLIIRDSFNQDRVEGMVKLLKYIVYYTLATEFAFALILFFRFCFDYPVQDAAGKAIFHSISAFCNAGFDTIGPESLTPYRNDIVINLSVMMLTIAGGLGFPVWMDLGKNASQFFKEKHSLRSVYHRLQLHTKMVLWITAILLVLPSIFYFVVEYNNPDTLGALCLKDKILSACFQSVTSRTVGFATLNQNDMTYSSRFLTIILMFIGGSPSGTAGGIKTTTLGVLMAAVYAIVQGNDRVHVFGRRIQFHHVQKALAVFFMGQSVIILSTMILSLTELRTGYPFSFLDLFFETTAAFSTTGLTLGITPHMSAAGKLVIICVMYIGRLGTVSVAAMITAIRNETREYYDFPEGKIIIG